jgi:hypothetical protein
MDQKEREWLEKNASRLRKDGYQVDVKRGIVAIPEDGFISKGNKGKKATAVKKTKKK